MKLFLCLDDKNGMAFCGRRQSMDRIVRQKMLELSCGARLYMNAYSAQQFQEEKNNIVTDEAFLEKAGAQDFCFAETCPVFFDAVTDLYIFRWNRIYPADLKADFSKIEQDFCLIQTQEFPGFSHECITLSIYQRREMV